MRLAWQVTPEVVVVVQMREFGVAVVTLAVALVVWILMLWQGLPGALVVWMGPLLRGLRGLSGLSRLGVFLGVAVAFFALVVRVLGGALVVGVFVLGEGLPEPWWSKD